MVRHSYSGLLLPIFGACASLGRTLAFVGPSPFRLLAYPKHGAIGQQQRCAFNSSPARGRGAGRSVGLSMSDDLAAAEASKTRNEQAEAKAAQLRAFAAELRAQAEALETARDTERQQAAQQAFASFDTNDDGTVDVKELIAGFEGQLRQDFVKRMTKKLQRKPSKEEVDEKIADMPGGVLLPMELAKKLIELYDTNGDGVLQLSEFAPKDDLRLKLEGLFADRAQEARMEAAAAREKEIEARGAQKAKEEAKARGLALPEDFNDGPPTVADKVLSALPYVLPLMDSLVFGAHIFTTYPTQLNVFEPIVAFLLIYRSLPFSGLILFFGLQWYASKPEVNKLVRFNLRQAVNLDIAMFFPSLLAFAAQFALGDDVVKLAPLASVGSDVIFVTVLVAVLYSIVSSALGVVPENLPIIGSMNRESSNYKGPGGPRKRNGDDDDSKKDDSE